MFTKKQNWILSVIVCFFVGTVLQNLLAVKTFEINGVSTVAGGIVLTWLVFACSDIITEIMGEKFAFRCCVIGTGVNLIWSLLCQIVIHIHGNNPYIADCVATVFGSTWRITLASTIAYIGGSWINNHIMGTLHRRDGDEKYYKRAILSTVAGQVFDDYVFVFLAFAPLGISAIENPWSAIAIMPLISAVTETIIESIFTPISKKVVEKIKSL